MAEQFNITVKELFRIFRELPVKTFKGRLHIKELHNKMMQGMKAEPLYALSVLGPHVWAARQEIADRNSSFFLTRRYELDITRLCAIHKVNYDDASNAVSFMKEAYSLADASQQATIMNLLTDLLRTVSKHELQKQT